MGVKDYENIKPDNSDRQENRSEQNSNSNRTTALLFYYRNEKTDTIWCYECTRDIELRNIDTGLKLYPITWLNWGYRQDNYHGQAMVSGLIPNQIFINRAFAMTMISLMTTAYPKIVYDATRISRWTNQVGAAIGVKGGDVNSVARIIDPAHVDPQISQFIQMAVNFTETFLGATPAALGDAARHSPERSETERKWFGFRQGRKFRQFADRLAKIAGEFPAQVFRNIPAEGEYGGFRKPGNQRGQELCF